MHFIFLENSINFTSSSLNLKAIDYIQKGIIYFSMELVKKGHQVTIYNNTSLNKNEDGIQWKQLSKINAKSVHADVVIICDDENLLGLDLDAKLKFFWIYSYTNFYDHKNVLVKLIKNKFILLYNSNILISSLPHSFKYIPKIKILNGVSDQFFNVENFNISKCQALVTVHPLRGLDWLIDLWVNLVSLKLPWAEMHIYSHSLFEINFSKNIKINNLKLKLLKYKDNGIHIKKPQPESDFIKSISDYKVHLNPNNDNKALSSSILESQASGIPIISRENSDIHDYIYHNETGFITNNQSIFANKTIDILSNNTLFLRMRSNSKLNNKIKKWREIVNNFEKKVNENIIYR